MKRSRFGEAPSSSSGSLGEDVSSSSRFSQQPVSSRGEPLRIGVSDDEMRRTDEAPPAKRQQQLSPRSRARMIAAELASITPSVSHGDSAGSDAQGPSRGNESFGNGSFGKPGIGGGIGLQVRTKIYIPLRDFPDVNFIGLLIGPSGSTIRKMQEDSGAKISIRGKGSNKDEQLDAAEEDDLHVLIVAEREEQLKAAEKMVREILFDPSHASDLKRKQLTRLGEEKNMIDSPDIVSETLQVPTHIVGAVIGRGGETIREFQDRSGAQIQVEADPPDPSSPTRAVTVRGRAECVKIGVELVEKLVEEKKKQHEQQQSKHQRSPTNAGDFLARIPIPPSKVGLIIGKQGSTINGLQQRYRCRIQVPEQERHEGGGDDRVVIIEAWTQQDVDAAKQEILRIVESQETFTRPAAPQMGTHTVPDDKVGLIIGKGGQNIKNIQNKSGTRIQVPPMRDHGSNPPTRTIQISGRPDQIQIAMQEINNIVYQQQQQHQHQHQQPYQGYQQQWQYYQQPGANQYMYNPPAHPSQQQAANPNTASQQQQQKYTREQWRQWKEYYAQFGVAMADEPPPELLADSETDGKNES